MRSRLCAGLAALCAAVAALPTISTKGSKFFTADGDQWFVKGIAYQLSPADPLVDTNQCQRDATLMKSLGANAIRVYHVDPFSDHAGCMTAFENAGIYLFVDLDTFTTQIEQMAPVWEQSQETAFQNVMDEFQKYDNTAGFFIGNEVITNGTFSGAALLVKAATRDLKTYRDSNGYRQIPIGYSHADVTDLRPNLQNYLACGTNTTDSIDFFGLNAYEWCGDNTYVGSGYQTLTQQVIGYPVPIFFSETGCTTERQNNGMQRTFQDQAAIFGPEMSPYWSGAIVYEWIQEANAYGLITYGGSTDADVTPVETQVVRSGTPTPVTPDFSNLKSAWATASASGVSEAAYSPTLTPPPCPSSTAGTWLINGDASIPPVGATLDASASSSLALGTTTQSGLLPASASSFADSSSTSSSAPLFTASLPSAASSSHSSSSPLTDSNSPPSGANGPTSTGSASPSSSSGAANANKELTGASFGLMGAMIGLVWL